MPDLEKLRLAANITDAEVELVAGNLRLTLTHGVQIDYTSGIDLAVMGRSMRASFLRHMMKLLAEEKVKDRLTNQQNGLY